MVRLKNLTSDEFWHDMRLDMLISNPRIGPSPFFSSFSVERVFWYWVGRSDWKKKKLKKIHKKSRNIRPWYPRTTLKVDIHIIWINKMDNILYNMLMVLFSVLLLCSFLRLKELFQVKNGLTTSLLFLFCFENAKNLGRLDDAKRRKKKRMALQYQRVCVNFQVAKGKRQ